MDFDLDSVENTLGIAHDDSASTGGGDGGSVLSNAWNAVSDGASAAWNTVSDGASAAYDTVSTGASNLVTTAKDDASAAWDAVSDVGSRLAQFPGRFWDQDKPKDAPADAPAAVPDQPRLTPEVLKQMNNTPERQAQDAKANADYQKAQEDRFQDYNARYPKLMEDWMAKKNACQSEAERAKLPPMPEDPIARRQRGGFQ
jgi:hypothetical protein